MKTLALTTIASVEQPRIKLGITHFDSFLGGGFVDGQAILIAGQPGVGKSTLLLQLSTILVDSYSRVLYVSGEESLEQIKLRADRLGTLRDSIYCSNGDNLNSINLEELYLEINRLDPKFIVIDSLQKLYSDNEKGDIATPRQTKYCLNSLIGYAKRTGRILIVIGHSTKTGMIAGLQTLQHDVDTVLFISKDTKSTRWITATKNRFGNVDEVFQMHMDESGFREFTSAIVKGTQVPPTILPYLQHIYGDEVKFTQIEIESYIKSQLVRGFYKGMMRFVQRTLFGQVIEGKYELVFKLRQD